VAAAPEPRAFEVERGGSRLRGEVLGDGPAVVLVHGLTATRRYVVHGSKALARSGFAQVSYDARAHGESDPAPRGEGYGYEHLSADLASVVSEGTEGPVVLCGDSMGAHTVASWALERSGAIAGVVLVRPVSLGLPAPPESLAYWDRLAAGLERGGVKGFMAAYEADLNVEQPFADTVLRFTRERMQLHRHPEALAEAVRQVARSVPFEGISELESLDLPALVVASRDEADPGHPQAVAEAWADALPRADLTMEGEGESPLAWQGGRLSRAIADFCGTKPVADRHRS
jgi:pimeloyl-ACP methyl ester carboxylesterase